MYQCETLEKALGTLLLCTLKDAEDGIAPFKHLVENGVRAGFTQEQVHDVVNSLANVAFVQLLVSPEKANIMVRRNPEKPLDVYAGKRAMQFG
jgi:hypothetical protein